MDQSHSKVINKLASQNFPAFYGNWRLIAMFTRARQMFPMLI